METISACARDRSHKRARARTQKLCTGAMFLHGAVARVCACARAAFVRACARPREKGRDEGEVVGGWRDGREERWCARVNRQSEKGKEHRWRGHVQALWRWPSRPITRCRNQTGRMHWKGFGAQRVERRCGAYQGESAQRWWTGFSFFEAAEKRAAVVGEPLRSLGRGHVEGR